MKKEDMRQVMLSLGGSLIIGYGAGEISRTNIILAIAVVFVWLMNLLFYRGGKCGD